MSVLQIALFCLASFQAVGSAIAALLALTLPRSLCRPVDVPFLGLVSSRQYCLAPRSYLGQTAPCKMFQCLHACDLLYSKQQLIMRT